MIGAVPRIGEELHAGWGMFVSGWGGGYAGAPWLVCCFDHGTDSGLH